MQGLPLIFGLATFSLVFGQCENQTSLISDGSTFSSPLALYGNSCTEAMIQIGSTSVAKYGIPSGCPEANLTLSPSNFGTARYFQINIICSGLSSCFNYTVVDVTSQSQTEMAPAVGIGLSCPLLPSSSEQISAHMSNISSSMSQTQSTGEATTLSFASGGSSGSDTAQTIFSLGSSQSLTSLPISSMMSLSTKSFFSSDVFHSTAPESDSVSLALASLNSTAIAASGSGGGSTVSWSQTAASSSSPVAASGMSNTWATGASAEGTCTCG